MRMAIANVMAARYNFFIRNSIVRKKEKIMPKGTNQKFKLYRLAQIMLKETDEDHFITLPEIQKALGAYEITADRKTLYADLKDLEVFGIVVEGSRWEGLSLPCGGAAFSAGGTETAGGCHSVFQFITVKKTRELIGNWKRWSAGTRPQSCSGRFLWQSASRP